MLGVLAFSSPSDQASSLTLCRGTYTSIVSRSFLVHLSGGTPRQCPSCVWGPSIHSVGISIPMTGFSTGPVSYHRAAEDLVCQVAFSRTINDEMVSFCARKNGLLG